eukprot:CAMPEP_0194216206 /NCGR_PEP_ID=MMETSP0156-20130528/18528_1 /TAXON_ID=33649 /ORGANISM="Thalassionema nitzschioides, Strain L26-B" /LENGTH=74 /DNA_ID=CAMNT_0038944917 /DNA_START=19 /DNA_END=243 /DNA_ORIENTATION=+
MSTRRIALFFLLAVVTVQSELLSHDAPMKPKKFKRNPQKKTAQKSMAKIVRTEEKKVVGITTSALRSRRTTRGA